jgi:hypothetical protein
MKIKTILIMLLAPTFPAFAQSPPPQAPQRAQAVEAFVEHVDREWPGEAHQQALTGKSLNLLVNAIESVAQRRQAASAEFVGELQEIRDETAKYTGGTPGDLAQSRQLRKTLRAAADIVQTLAVRTGIASSMEQRLNALNRAARSLDDDQPLRRQPDVLERFFHHAAEILKTIDAR